MSHCSNFNQCFFLSGFFGLGMVLKSYIQGNSAFRGASQAGLETYIFGQAAYMLEDDVKLIALVAVLCAALLFLFYKELKLSTFDEENARLIGMATGAIFYALMTLISLTTVAAFDAVGSILVISFFIAPAAAALLFTKRLHHALFLAVFFGVLGSAIGYGLALHFNASMAGMCALVNMLIYVVAVFVHPKGVITRRLKRMRRKARLKEELLIIHLGTHTAENLYSEENAVRDIAEHLRWSEREMRRVSERLKEAGIVRRSGGYYLLTDKGVERYRALCEEYVI